MVNTRSPLIPCLLFFIAVFAACSTPPKKNNNPVEKIIIDDAKAALLFSLPTHCLTQEYPNKLGQVIGSAADLKSPKSLRPVFYGCFDWHSAVHGYWSIVKLMKSHPSLDADAKVRSVLNSHITSENVSVEMAFLLDSNNLSFERTYGWAWLLKLQQELETWGDPDAQRWHANLQPLADLIVERTIIYLPKLLYPIRAGQHDNTAFSLTLMYDYADNKGDLAFKEAIKAAGLRLFQDDQQYDFAYEPSGYDFLSPGLEEALLMSKLLPDAEYAGWLYAFLPELKLDGLSNLHPAEIKDRSDGKLVHLDGLNFSRAYCLQGIAKKLPSLSDQLLPLANQHIAFSLDNIANDDYMGSHWLGSFALLALSNQ